MATVLEYLEKNESYTVWLQVYENSKAAHNMYESSGFIVRAIRTIWEKKKRFNGIEKEPSLQIIPRRLKDWDKQKEWLLRLYPDSINWFFDFNPKAIGPSVFQNVTNWLSGRIFSHWSAIKKHLVRVLTYEQTKYSLDYL